MRCPWLASWIEIVSLFSRSGKISNINYGFIKKTATQMFMNRTSEMYESNYEKQIQIELPSAWFDGMKKPQHYMKNHEKWKRKKTKLRRWRPQKLLCCSLMLNFDAVWIVVISHKWSADLVRTTINVFSKRVALAYNWFLIYCSGMSSCHIWAEPSMSTSLMISFFAFSIV